MVAIGVIASSCVVAVVAFGVVLLLVHLIPDVDASMILLLILLLMILLVFLLLDSLFLFHLYICIVFH